MAVLHPSRIRCLSGPFVLSTVIAAKAILSSDRFPASMRSASSGENSERCSHRCVGLSLSATQAYTTCHSVIRSSRPNDRSEKEGTNREGCPTGQCVHHIIENILDRNRNTVDWVSSQFFIACASIPHSQNDRHVRVRPIVVLIRSRCGLKTLVSLLDTEEIRPTSSLDRVKQHEAVIVSPDGPDLKDDW